MRVGGLDPPRWIGGSCLEKGVRYWRKKGFRDICAYGAALVSSRICLSLRSCGSGRFWRCFSRELRRSRGEMGEVSTVSEEVSVFSVGVSVFSVIIAGVFCLVDGFLL